MDVSIGSMLTKTQRLILGLFVLLLVDVIWVSTSELTKVKLGFRSPYFMCTYPDFCYSTYIIMKNLENHFSTRISKHHCSHYIYWDYVFGPHGENNSINLPIIW